MSGGKLWNVFIGLRTHVYKTKAATTTVKISLRTNVSTTKALY
jgi:hypothetical protein